MNPDDPLALLQIINHGVVDNSEILCYHDALKLEIVMENPLDKLDTIAFLNLVQDILECEIALTPSNGKSKTFSQMSNWVKCMQYDADPYSVFHDVTFFTEDQLKTLYISGIYAFAYLRITKECSQYKD